MPTVESPWYILPATTEDGGIHMSSSSYWLALRAMTQFAKTDTYCL